MKNTRQTTRQSGLGRLGNHANRGVALIIVMAVLVALVVIATPFAISMRLQERSARNQSAQAEARQLARSARNAIAKFLYQTTRSSDTTPEWDDKAEFDAIIATTVLGTDRPINDPTGYLVGGLVEDEQGKVNLNSASPWLVGNVIGSALIAEAVGEDATELAVDDASHFPAKGFLWVNGEIIKYAARSGNRFSGCTRGVLGDNIEFAAPMSQGRDNLVVDLRAYLTMRARLTDRAIGCRPYANVSSLRTLIEQPLDLPEMAGFSSHELNSLEPYLTVHSSRDTQVGWTAGRRVIEVVRQDGEPDKLRVLDNSVLAPGSVIRVTKPAGTPEFAFVRQRGRGGVVVLDRVLTQEYVADEAVVEVEIRHPINPNTAPRQVLVACFYGLRTWWDMEATTDRSGGTNRSSNSVNREEAEKLADRIGRYGTDTGHPLRHFQDFRELVEAAVAAGDITERDQFSILLNARNPNDPRVLVSTTGFCYHSADIFTIEASGVVNSPAGVPVATHRIREIVELSPPKTAAVNLDSQYHFQREVWLGHGYKVVSWPNYVQVWERLGLPEYFPSLDAAPGVNTGTIRLDSGRVETDMGGLSAAGAGGQGGGRRPRNVEHCDLRDGFLAQEKYKDFTVWPDGLQFKAVPISVPAQGQGIIRDPENAERDIRAGTIDFWFKPQWTDRGADQYLFDFGMDRNVQYENRISLFFDSANQEIVLRCCDATIEESAAEVRYPVDSKKFANDIWYHLAASWRGTGFGELMLLVDGQAVGRFEHRTRDGEALVTELSGDIDAMTATIPVDDTSGFPDQGILLVGGEAVCYTKTTGSQFVFEPYAEFQPIPTDAVELATFPQWMKTGRGARGTTNRAHRSGTPVTVWGFTTQADEDIRLGGGTVSEQGFGDNTYTRVVDSTTVPATGGTPPTGGGGTGDGIFQTPPPPTPKYPGGLMASATEVLVTDTSEFSATGYLIFFAVIPAAPATGGSGGSGGSGGGGANDGIFLPQDDTPPTTGGGTGGTATNAAGDTLIYEFVYYSGKESTKFTGLTRGLFNTTAQEFPPLVTGVYMISVPSSDASGDKYAPNGWIQCGNEWFAYDRIENPNGRWYFVKTEGVVEELTAAEPDDGTGTGTTPTGSKGNRGTAPGTGAPTGGGSSGIFLPQDGTPTTPAPTTPDPNDTTNKLDFTFREIAKTMLGAHEMGEKIIPVWKTKSPVSGRFDSVTVLSKGPDQDVKEARQVNWSWSLLPVNTTTWVHLQALTDFVSQPYLMAGTRVLKFPSGELASRIGPDIVVGAAMGGASTGGVIDEIRFSAATRRRMIVAGLTDYGEDATDVQIAQAGALEAGPGVVLTAGSPAGQNPSQNPAPVVQAPPVLQTDGGLFRVGDEVFGYTNFDINPTSATLRGCKRGMLGSEARVLSVGASIMDAYFLDVTKTAQAGDATSGYVRVESAAGFPEDGYIRIGGELVGYTRLDRQLGFVMPVRPPEKEGDTAGEGLLRGAYGSPASGFGAGDLVVGMPFRYYDRYAERSDAPELAYVEQTFAAKDAQWLALRWTEENPDPMHLGVQVLARVDGAPAWGSEPTNKPGGIYAFNNAEAPNGLMVQGDTLEVRIYFVYKPGAWSVQGAGETQSTRPAWKQTPIIHRLEVEYAEPTVVHRREEMLR